MSIIWSPSFFSPAIKSPPPSRFSFLQFPFNLNLSLSRQSFACTSPPDGACDVMHHPSPPPLPPPPPVHSPTPRDDASGTFLPPPNLSPSPHELLYRVSFYSFLHHFIDLAYSIASPNCVIALFAISIGSFTLTFPLPVFACHQAPRVRK